MSALIWHLKPSFIDYVTALPDGAITADEGAVRATDGSFRFPISQDDRPSDDSDGRLEYAGRVTFVGYSGLLRVSLVEPGVDTVGGQSRLSVVDTAYGDDRTRRTRLCSLESVDDRIGPGHASVMHSYLSIDGLHIFDGNYPAGTEFGDVIITA
jgi:hypothetical protein